MSKQEEATLRDIALLISANSGRNFEVVFTELATLSKVRIPESAKSKSGASIVNEEVQQIERRITPITRSEERPGPLMSGAQGGELGGRTRCLSSPPGPNEWLTSEKHDKEEVKSCASNKSGGRQDEEEADFGQPPAEQPDVDTEMTEPIQKGGEGSWSVINDDGVTATVEEPVNLVEDEAPSIGELERAAIEEHEALQQVLTEVADPPNSVGIANYRDGVPVHPAFDEEKGVEEDHVDLLTTVLLRTRHTPGEKEPF